MPDRWARGLGRGGGVAGGGVDEWWAVRCVCVCVCQFMACSVYCLLNVWPEWPACMTGRRQNIFATLWDLFGLRRRQTPPPGPEVLTVSLGVLGVKETIWRHPKKKWLLSLCWVWSRPRWRRACVCGRAGCASGALTAAGLSWPRRARRCRRSSSGRSPSGCRSSSPWTFSGHASAPSIPKSWFILKLHITHKYT